MIKKFFKINNEKLSQPCVFYMHPWELDPDSPVNTNNIRDKFIISFNRKKMVKKTKMLLDSFQFITVKKCLGLK